VCCENSVVSGNVVLSFNIGRKLGVKISKKRTSVGLPAKRIREGVAILRVCFLSTLLDTGFNLYLHRQRFVIFLSKWDGLDCPTSFSFVPRRLKEASRPDYRGTWAGEPKIK